MSGFLKKVVRAYILLQMLKLRLALVIVCIVSVSQFALRADEAVSVQKPTSNAHLVLRAFMVSYPDRISGVDYDFAERDWYMTIGGKRLYWAEGRLLPLEQAGDPGKWRPYVDYLYPRRVPDPSAFPAEVVAALNARVLAAKRKNGLVYNIAFYDALYDGKTRRRIESHITRFDYLGKRVSVHRSIVPALKRVERTIQELAKRDHEVRKFLETLSSIDGYNWREVRDSPLRSNHSWGIAIDFLPRNWGQKNIYWNWISDWNDRWMLIPPERRWAPPEAVVRAFEDEGFVWGGKWLLWDTMHFEYRPELLTLQRWGHAGEDYR